MESSDAAYVTDEERRAARRSHQPDNQRMCRECGQSWPCTTYRAINALEYLEAEHDMGAVLNQPH